MQSFRVFPDVKPFIQFKVTIQTVYWTILCLAILVLSIWILNTQMELLEIVQDIENSQ
jgi:cell division protein FtsL